MIMQLMTVGCIHHLKGLCVTTVQYQNYSKAANLSKELSYYLNGTWNHKFENLTGTLRSYIIAINASHVDVATIEQMSNLFVSLLG